MIFKCVVKKKRNEDDKNYVYCVNLNIILSTILSNNYLKHLINYNIKSISWSDDDTMYVY